MESARWLLFIKVVSQAVKRLKNIIMIEKDYDNWKKLWWLKKGCDNWKGFCTDKKHKKHQKHQKH